MQRHQLSCSQEDWIRTGDMGSFGPRFVLALALRIAGTVDAGALQGALDDVVERHEILRSVVVRDADPPYMVVRPPDPVPLEIRDLTGDPRPGHEIGEDLLNAAQASALPVEELPLLRATLARLGAADSVLVLVTHHSASDGWSVNLLRRDLAALYRARVTGVPAELPEPRQYREWAAWQRERVEGPGAEKALDFWRAELAGTRVSTLPTDRPVPAAYSQPYRARNFMIGADVMERVNALAAQTRGSAFSVMLAAMGVLLHRITGRTDPVVNTLTAGRSERAFRNTFGLFLNFLPLHTDLAACESFQDAVLAARHTVLAAYSHELPILTVERANPHLMAPLADPANCDFIFGFARPLFSAEESQIADGTEQIILLEEESAEIPGGIAWTMAVLPSGETFGKVQYNPESFDPATVDAWVEAYRSVLAAGAADPARPWKSL